VKRLCLILAAALGAGAAPALAEAGTVALRVQTVAPGARQLAAAPMHFNMLAFKGRGAIGFRTHRIHGGWSGWQQAGDDPTWTGGSDAFQVRSRGAVRAYELWSRVTSAPRALQEAAQPAIVTRADWGADEEIVRAKPLYAAAVKLAVVHHTASTNAYTPAQAAAIVRGIETFHVKGNGWNDIGYNFLVDRFGNVYEGRGGGIDRNVVGAHAEGFNTGTVGVSLIGNFQRTAPTKAAQAALVRLLAWRLDVAHVDPLSTVAYTSGGNAKFRSGKVVTLRAVSGHRDTGPSECPGQQAYALLPAIAKRVAATGLPKLYAPTLVGALGGPIRFKARLSGRLPWTVTVADRAGRTVATGTGNGSVVDWTWQSPSGARGPYAWTISAPGIRVATGVLGKGAIGPPPVLSLSALTSTPAVMTPNADGSTSPAVLSFVLGTPATVTARVVDAATAVTALSILSGNRPAGTSTIPWDPARVAAPGRYQVVVTAAAAGKSVTKWVDVIVDRTVSGFSVAPTAFSPNHDLMLDTTTFSFLLAAPSQVSLQVQSLGAVVADVFAGALPAGAHTVSWDGSGFGPPLLDGTYTAVLTVTDAIGDVPVPIPVRIDTTPPKLTLVDKSTLAFTVDEPATVTAVVNGSTVVTVDAQPGRFTVPIAGAVATVSAQAVDAAGNSSPTVSG
jgi:N-acetylmuramoyl-L-alanine amidase